MATHRFSVLVPNSTAQPVAVQLSLEPEKKANLKGLRLPDYDTALEVTNAFLSRDCCAPKGERTMTVKLDPYGSAEVFVIVQTPSPVKPGTAYFNVVDRRGADIAGGVLIICQEPALPEQPGQTVSSSNPSPVALKTDIYLIEQNADPTAPLPKDKITPGLPLSMVAQITNPTAKPLDEVTVYLEHLGTSSMEAAAGIWNVGTLAPNDVFYASWDIKTPPGQSSVVRASIVAGSKGTEPVRLNGGFEFLVNNKDLR